MTLQAIANLAVGLFSTHLHLSVPNRPGPPARAGFDLTFSAPKSVSLLYALSDRDVSATVRAVHADAVAQALDYLERRALSVRRGARGLRRIGGRVWSASRRWDHLVAGWELAARDG